MKLLRPNSFKGNPFSKDSECYFSLEGYFYPIDSLSVFNANNTKHFLMSYQGDIGGNPLPVPRSWKDLIEDINKYFFDIENNYAIAGISGGPLSKGEYFFINNCYEINTKNIVIFSCIRDYI